jgi:NAD(P)-dependent dehydrogenase (short-subunit alcohol dehydrogenase family)
VRDERRERLGRRWPDRQDPLEKAGRIDALVNNAGGSILGAVEETSIEQARSLSETNVLGVLRMSQADEAAPRAENPLKVLPHSVTECWPTSVIR